MKQQSPTIDQIYPELSGKELQAAEENLTAYLAVVLRMYQRLEHDEAAMAELRALTEAKTSPSLWVKVDSKQP